MAVFGVAKLVEEAGLLKQATETGEECPGSKGFFERLKEAWSGLAE